MKECRVFENQLLGERFREILVGGRLRTVVYDKPGFRKTFALAISRFGGGDLMLPDGFPIPEGVAHFFEHRLFTKLDGDISRRFSSFGMAVNAATGHSRTAYHFVGSENFARGVELLLELVFSPHFPSEGIETERQIIAREIAETNERPETKLYANLHRALYHAHPVRREILGSSQTLSQITPEILYRCHETYYCPENMIFFLYGAGATGDALAAMEDYLAGSLELPAGRAVPLLGVEEPLEVVSERVEARHRVSRPHLAIGWKTSVSAPAGRAYLEESIATHVAIDLIFGVGSTWFESQYAQGQLDDSFAATYVHDLDYGYVVASGETRDPDALEAAVRDRVAAALAGDLEREALQRVQHRMAGNFLRSFNTPEDALALFANYYLVDADPLVCVEIADGLTMERVEAKVKEVFAPQRTSVSLLRPI